MKKVTIPTNEGIDWSKPQWVISGKNDIIVLTTGENSEKLFAGTAIPCHGYPNGEYRIDWYKDYFQPLTFDIPFTISNSNE